MTSGSGPKNYSNCFECGEIKERYRVIVRDRNNRSSDEQYSVNRDGTLSWGDTITKGKLIARGITRNLNNLPPELVLRGKRWRAGRLENCFAK